MSPPTGTHEATAGLGRPLALRRRPFPGTPILPQSLLLQRASSLHGKQLPLDPLNFRDPGLSQASGRRAALDRAGVGVRRALGGADRPGGAPAEPRSARGRGLRASSAAGGVGAPRAAAG